MRALTGGQVFADIVTFPFGIQYFVQPTHPMMHFMATRRIDLVAFRRLRADEVVINDDLSPSPSA